MNNLKEFFFDKNNYNFIAKLLLITALVIYLLPLIVGFEGICYDDAAFISFPRIFAAARSFHNGEIPLWDSNLYCGAKPYYTMFESPVYNILLYPFFFFADLNNIDQSFFVLYIIPFCLLTIFSGFGAYYLFKDVIKSNCFISALCGIFYAINPSMGISSLSLIDTFVFAYMPWVILSIAKFLETHKFKWWLMGVIFFVLMNCAYTLNYTIRIYFVVAVIALILFINYFMKDKRNIKYIIFTIFIFIFALGLTSFIWGGIIEGIIWTEKKIERRFFSQIIKEITYSVPPTHLITLFIPGFNGTLDNYHTWGDGFLIHSADRIFSGGTAVSFLVIVSFLILIYGKKHNFNIDKNTKLWLFIGHIMNIFAISVMLGRYSPVFYLLFKILPWFFAIPYPFYYHFAQHFGTIIIIASILKIIYKNRKNIHKIINLRTSLIYIGFILFFISVYLILPVYYPESIKAKKLNNFGTLFLYRDFKWFFTNPVILFLLGSCLSIFSGKYINKNFHFTMNLLIIGIMIEYFLLGYTVLYRNQIMPRAHSINKWQAYIRKRHVLPSKFSFYDPVKDLNKFTKKSHRFIADISLAENLAWFSNTRSFVGYDSKPTMKKFQNLSQKFYKNWPYEMWAYS
ncbi:MAG: hypothetical protein JXB50_15220, partial [Spirochaetes bacterium]|nr:hypothetical protein [Spirochaetota bacterium]